ncbi:MAG: YlxM family DNA-binding protein [Oscillospiraceae bacterium]
MAKNLEVSYLLDFYGEVLTEKQRDVMEQYYNDDLSLAEIAENFSISRQGVRDAIKRGEGTMLELEQKIGFAKRYRAVQDSIVSLEHLARNINFCNANNYTVSDDITKSCDEMLSIISKISDDENV